MKTILVKKTPDAIRALTKANVPSFVVVQIIGTEQSADESMNIIVSWLGKPTTWCLPPDAVELVTTKK